LIPRVTHWSEGWRSEVLVDKPGDGGDIVIGAFVATRAEAVEAAMAKVDNWPGRVG
jgi:hypothetical protein